MCAGGQGTPAKPGPDPSGTNGDRGSYDVRTIHRDVDSEIERLRVQALLGWKKAAQRLRQMGLRDGMRVLEVGAGPGFITEKLLELVPKGTITALDVDPLMTDRSRQRLGKDPRLRFVTASVTGTGLPDGAFDFAFARLVFQHLPDPDAAAREIFRVLRPGGRFVISDDDDAIGMIAEPTIPEVPAIIEAVGRAQAARGGNRYIGRRLWRILRAAGFQDLDLDVVIAHSDGEGMEPFLVTLDPDMLTPLVRAGFLTKAHEAAVRAAWTRFRTSPDAFVAIVGLMAAGTKPP